jgi:hypothetical protein
MKFRTSFTGQANIGPKPRKENTRRLHRLRQITSSTAGCPPHIVLVVERNVPHRGTTISQRPEIDFIITPTLCIAGFENRITICFLPKPPRSHTGDPLENAPCWNRTNPVIKSHAVPWCIRCVRLESKSSSDQNCRRRVFRLFERLWTV